MSKEIHHYPNSDATFQVYKRLDELEKFLADVIGKQQWLIAAINDLQDKRVHDENYCPIGKIRCANYSLKESNKDMIKCGDFWLDKVMEVCPWPSKQLPNPT